MRIFFGNWRLQGWLVVSLAICAVPLILISVVGWREQPGILVLGAASVLFPGFVILRLSVFGVRGRFVGWLPRVRLDTARVKSFRVRDAASADARIVAEVDGGEIVMLVAPCPWFASGARHEAALNRTVRRLERWCVIAQGVRRT